MEKTVKHGKIQDSGIHIYLRIVKFLSDSYSLTESQWEDGTYTESPAATVLYCDYGTADWQCILAAFLENSV